LAYFNELASFNKKTYLASSDWVICNHMFFSICIPAYKNTEFLKRLLDSITLQTFKDFEVIICDDSRENNVEVFCNLYKNNFDIRYFRNPYPLGSPENWNEAIRQAKGEWIKLMHDDDWFAHASSLEEFAHAIRDNPETDFFFSAYSNYYFDDVKYKEFRITPWWFRQLNKDPVILFSRNVIGAPSVVIYKRSLQIEYDRNIKWLVDIDFYIRVLGETKPVYIDKALIHIGIGKEQITRDCFRKRPVEIPESFHLLKKTGLRHLQNIIVYDAWWRLMRNLEIKTENEIFESGYHEAIPGVIKRIIKFQKGIPTSILNNGVLSKTFMAIGYLFNHNKMEK
jgi:glycosyltransferase involved in cell wall biosynthesis